MDNFRVIYKILHYLEKAMDYDEPDMDMISPESLKITENRWMAIMKQLYKDGFIEGLTINKSADGTMSVISGTPQITIKGLEYLSENSLMKKAAEVAKGVVTVAAR